MTTDEQITQDLAIVARSSRARPVALEATLQAVGALATAKPSTPRDGFPIAQIYVARLARASAGVASVVCIAALVGFLRFGYVLGRGTVLDALGWMPKLWVATSVLCVVFATHILASRIAVAKLARGARPDERARGLARWSVAAPIAGAMALALYFGMMQVVLAGFPLEAMSPHMVTYLPWLDIRTLQLAAHVLLIVAIVASIAGAIIIARVRSVRVRWMVPVGVVLLATTIVVGLRFDVVPLMPPADALYVPSVPLRAALTATGTAGMLLAVGGIVLGVRRREDALLERAGAGDG